MRHVIFILPLLITVTAQAQTYYLQPVFFASDNNETQLIRDASGAILRVSSECEIPDHTPAEFSTVLKTLVYRSQIPTIVDDEIYYMDATVICDVYDYMGIYKTNLITYTPFAKYDIDHGFLDLRNIQLMRGYEPTGEIFGKATLIYNSDFECFAIEALEP